MDIDRYGRADVGMDRSVGACGYGAGMKQVVKVPCGFVGHADHNAAVNIAVRGVERWGEVMRPHAAPTLTAS